MNEIECKGKSKKLIKKFFVKKNRIINFFKVTILI